MLTAGTDEDLGFAPIKALKKGAKATGRGIKKGAKATGKFVRKGVCLSTSIVGEHGDKAGHPKAQAAAIGAKAVANSKLCKQGEKYIETTVPLNECTFFQVIKRWFGGNPTCR